LERSIESGKKWVIIRLGFWTNCYLGNLDGLTISGLYADCRPILQSFLDRTGDIQTVAIISALTICNDDSGGDGI
jgi:hypothetical protein